MLIKSKIGVKLGLIILVVNIFALLMLSLLFYEQFQTALNDRILLQLTSIKKLKHKQIEEYLNRKLSGFSSFIPQQNYGNNRLPFISEDDSIIIRNKGEEYHDFPESYGRLFIPSVENTGTAIIDLSDSNAKKEMLAAFVKNISAGKELVLITPLKQIQDIVLERTGMGETGETYIVGDDYKMRSISRFYLNKKPLEIIVNTVGVEASLNGITGTGVFDDYRDELVFSSYQPLKFYHLNWVILSEIDAEEVFIPLSTMRRNLIFIGLIIFLILVLLSFFISQAIVRPVVKMKDILNQMALGKIVQVKNTDKVNDEIGQMSQALNKHIRALQEIASFADLIGSQKFDADYKLLSPEDALGASLIQMRDKLREYRQKEEVYRKEKEKALWQGQERERSRLSKELHDGLGPLLTTLKLTVSGVNMADQDKEKLKKQLDETIAEIRHMSYNLMPQALLDFGVGKALGNLIDLLSKISSIDIRYMNAMKERSKIPEEINIGIYRIAQEALNNAIKYSQASEIKISLTEFDDYISLYIKDNGVGFNKLNGSGGTGLLNMKERASVLNGTFQVDTSSLGTIIEVEIPLSVKE